MRFSDYRRLMSEVDKVKVRAVLDGTTLRLNPEDLANVPIDEDGRNAVDIEVVFEGGAAGTVVTIDTGSGAAQPLLPQDGID